MSNLGLIQSYFSDSNENNPPFYELTNLNVMIILEEETRLTVKRVIII